MEINCMVIPPIKGIPNLPIFTTMDLFILTISNFNILDKSNTEWMQKLQIQQSATKAKEH